MRHKLEQEIPWGAEVPANLSRSGSIPGQIRRIRTVLGMTQSQLARRTGISQSAVANIENNPAADLQLSTIEKLAKALDCGLLLAVVPNEKIADKLEERSKSVARKLIRISSGNAALEMQVPDAPSVAMAVENMQKELLARHRKWLWEKI
ncbi:MAG TPA: helix-turn-helix domain-containing protein [bacterium]|nr:helix-turn-helix domain-containing protein [bacterium]